MLILYGSQTGTAQDVAERIWRRAKQLNKSIESIVSSNLKIYSMDDYEISRLIDERLIIFVCSTTGQGDEPDNMKRFWRFLCRRNLPENIFEHLNVAVLGLGDSSYQKFNFAAKKLFRRLEQLGAKHFLPLGLADDQDELGYDFVVDSWIRDLFLMLESKFDVEKKINSENNDLEPKYRIVWTNHENSEIIDNRAIDQSIVDESSINRLESTANEISNKKSIIDRSNPFPAKLIANDRMTHEDHFQETRLIKLSIDGSSIDFRPGDIVYVQPKNLDEYKTEFLSLLDHLEIDRFFDLTPTDSCFKLPLPSILAMPSTFRQCADSFFDLQSIPRRSFFDLLSRFALADSLEHEKLLEFASSQGQEDYFAYCTRPRRTIVETMRDFPRTIARVPIDFWFDLIPSIRPRAFSIASCLDFEPKTIEILLGVVRYKTKLYEPRLGLCSNWINRLPLGSRVPVWVAKGTIDFSWSDRNPRILVGPGTGVAPFRSFLQWCSKNSRGDNHLFFGCRNEMMDFYFRNEFETMEKEGILNLFVAFSRDQEKKLYVQHKIKEHGRFLAELISEKKARLFVAGNAKQMPKDVMQVLKEILKDYFGEKKLLLENDLDAFVDDYVARMEKEKRLQMETWS